MRLSISEIAKRLDLNTVTVRRWIRQGKMPVVKEGDNGIFSKSDPVEWARTHKLSYVEPAKTDGSKVISDNFILLSPVKRGGVYRDIGAESKDGVLKKAVDLVPGISDAVRDTLFRQVLEREEMTSTGIGNGVAIPHPRNPLADEIDNPVIVTCFFSNGIEFSAIDSIPVFALFLLISSSTEEHLSILSRLSFFLRERAFIDFLREPPDADRFFQKIEELEAKMETNR